MEETTDRIEMHDEDDYKLCSSHDEEEMCRTHSTHI
jgi:hypothetical protein